MARNITAADPILAQRVGSIPGLGAAVRAQRQSQRLRIDNAASLCGVSVDALSRLERGQGAVRLDSLLKVIDGLGMALVLCPKTWEGLSLVPEPAAHASTPLVAQPKKRRADAEPK